MHSLNPIYVKQMVDAVRTDIERDIARRELIGMQPKSSFVANSRRVIGASFIGAGKFIQGRPKAEAEVDPCVSPSGLKLARSFLND